MILRALVPCFALAMAACQNMPPPYAPPEQRSPLGEFRRYRVEHIADLTSGDMSMVAGDILRPTGGWSWTGQRPAVRVHLRGNAGVRHLMDFAVADATFAKTGPVTVKFLVNGNVLETRRFNKPGPQHFEHDVPAGWVLAGQDNVVSAEVDKIWTSPDDGAKLGLILMRMGLTEQ